MMDGQGCVISHCSTPVALLDEYIYLFFQSLSHPHRFDFATMDPKQSDAFDVLSSIWHILPLFQAGRLEQGLESIFRSLLR